MVTEAQVRDALKVVQDPDLGQDIVSLGFVKRVSIDEGRVGRRRQARLRVHGRQISRTRSMPEHHRRRPRALQPRVTFRVSVAGEDPRQRRSGKRVAARAIDGVASDADRRLERLRAILERRDRQRHRHARDQTKTVGEHQRDDQRADREQHERRARDRRERGRIAARRRDEFG
jgi:hypothetical protein